MSRRLASGLAVLLAAAAAPGATGAGEAAAAAGPAGEQPAYCSLPPGPATPVWGFHVGAPIQGMRGTYAHGRGTLTGSRATGQICQVDRSAGGPDRQIILTVAGGAVVPQHAVTIHGSIGNRMVLPVRVAATTDPRCAVGTRGTVTLFSSYGGPRLDAVQLAFSGACRDHDHHYSGPQVVTEVPR